MAQIQNLDQLLTFMWEVSEGRATVDDVELMQGCATIPIRMQGVTWDKRIDIRSAQFVLDMQRELRDFCKQYPHILGSEAPLIKVAIRQGSGILDPDFLSVIKEALPNMNAKTAAVLITLIITMGGYQAWDRYQTSQDNARANEVSVVAIQSMKEVAMKQGFDPVKYEAPFRKLASSLKEGDKISVAGGVELPATEAKKFVRLKPVKTLEITSPCDGVYQLTKIDLTKPTPVLELSQGDFHIKAFLEHLSDEARQAFLKSIEERIESKQVPLNLTIQLDVRYTDKKVKSGSIVGVGAAREGLTHKTLADLPSNKK
ncbi:MULTISPECIES: hypothetical protein [unclassified Maridesulfovibrio]|uniref:hypothetical protein n=1 Tax=unclassified Maridesulfovibrio TaxID=2794999 RepID=UPI003B3F1700